MNGLKRGTPYSTNLTSCGMLIPQSSPINSALYAHYQKVPGAQMGLCDARTCEPTMRGMTGVTWCDCLLPCYMDEKSHRLPQCESLCWPLHGTPIFGDKTLVSCECFSSIHWQVCCDPKGAESWTVIPSNRRYIHYKQTIKLWMCIITDIMTIMDSMDTYNLRYSEI